MFNVSCVGQAENIWNMSVDCVPQNPHKTQEY